MRTLMFTFCLLAGSVLGFGQFIDRQVLFIRGDSIPLKAWELIEVNAGRPVSAVCFRGGATVNFENAFILSASDTFPLSINEHVSRAELITSNLVIFPEPIEQFRLFPGRMKDSIEVFLIPEEFAKGPELPESGQPDGRPLKTMPSMIEQSVWRAGLPEPDYPRILNQVKNVIIHHSATSNQVKDFTRAVRSIYLYHTQVNHWSDIGYNYLVAPTGLIYKGRDPGIHTQDEVLGAHFCSSNTGTLGICMIGTYMETSPPPRAMQSLEELIVWKLAKDHLDPLGVAAHPLNPDLDVIAGHRNGCATLCPGDSLYADIPILRNRVHETMVLLGTGPHHLSEPGQADQSTFVYPNPVRDVLFIDTKDEIREIRIFDAHGRLVHKLPGPADQIGTSDWLPGWYVILLVTEKQVFSIKILKKI